MNEVCSDNRFELIEKYKNKLIESTNIEDDADDMKAIDSILFRFWQMGWLDKLELMPCEEAISKYAILKDLKECKETSENNLEDAYDSGEVEGLRKAIECVNEMPLVYPKIKTGHWIPSHIPESILDECSECGFSCGAFTFNYCPMCGARMEKEKP